MQINYKDYNSLVNINRDDIVANNIINIETIKESGSGGYSSFIFRVWYIED